MTKTTEKPRLSRKELTVNVRAMAEKAMLDTLNKFDTNQFAAKIMRDLEAQRDQVVWKVLGLDHSFGEWRVDHCNGRTSQITEYLSTEVKPILHEWLNETVKDVLARKADGIRKYAIKAVEDEVRRMMDYAVRDFARQQVGRHIEQVVREVTEEVLAETVAP